MRVSRTEALTVAFALAASLLCCARESCAYTPLPWDGPADSAYDAPSPGPVPRRRPRRRRRRGRTDMFGTVGLSYDWGAHLAGDVQGTGGGTGYSLAIPATLPGWLLYGVFVDPMAVFAPATAEAWTSGFRGDGLGTAPVIDEVAFEFIYSVGSHEDLVAGGDLTLTRYGLGIRTTGPGPIGRRVRGVLALGWCWHDMSFDNRSDIDASGPYVATGIEFRFEPPDSRTLIGLKLDARWDFTRGLDGSGGAVDVEFFTAGAGVQIMW